MPVRTEFISNLRTLLAGATALTALAACSPSAGGTLPVLRHAPEWKLTDLAGREIGSAALKGKVVVLDFWATWCPPCREEIPGYIALQKKYAAKGLVVVGLSVDQEGEDVVRKFMAQEGMNYPVAMADDAVVQAFGGFSYIPTTFLIDRDGNIRNRKTGAVPAAEYEKLVRSLL